MLLIAIMGTLNATLADDITVGDVSNSDCSHMTRAEGVLGHTILRLTRSEIGLVGELRDFGVNCGYGDVNVLCEEDGENLTIVVDDGSGDHKADCICPINIYFTLFNAMQEEFYLKVRGSSERNVGMISLKDHTMVEIDLATLVILYDEGFEYHLRTQNIGTTSMNDPDLKNVSQKLNISHESEKVFNCTYDYYILPSNYSYLDVKATLDNDSTLVIDVLTDGIPENAKQIGRLHFKIVNTTRDDYHLKVNQTFLQGSEDEQTNNLYDGDITVPLYENVSIPLAPTSTSLYIEPLWYYADMITETASVVPSDTYMSLSDIVILPSVEMEGIKCTVDRIEDSAFNGMTNLESITIPDGVREIGQAAFYGCTSLASITIPEGVIEIRNQTFQKCTGLTSVSFPSSLVSIGDDSFGDCFGLTSVTLPHGLTSIGWRAFMRCRNLKEIDIPASVTSIDDDAFAYCEQLEDVYCRAATPPYTNNSRNFRKSNPEATLHVPAASLQVYKETAPWRNFKYILPLETDIATWEVQTGEVTSIQAGSPVDVTKESSSIQLVYRNIPVMKFDNITSISFKGYNPGREQVRHLKVWLASGESGRYSEEVCVFDDNCSIPKGGTAEECIPLLRLNFNSPYEYHAAERFYVRIECTGEAEEELLFFECQNDDQPVATFDVSAEVKYFSGTLADQDGRPIKGARVNVYHYNDDTKTTEVEYTAESDADGHYSVRVEQSNLGYLLTISAPDFPRYQADYIFYLNANSYSYPSPPSDITMFNKLDFKAGQQATIILPVAPDPSWGRYYRLDRRENIYDIIFEREYEPQANVPYVIFPERDFSIDLSSYDLENLPEPGFVPFPDNDMYRPLGLHGTYESCYAYKETVPSWFASLLDDTPDCIPETSNSFARVGAFRAYLLAADATQINCIFKGENDDTNLAYRPMIEDDKVWKVGAIVSGNPVQWVQYYYLDGDTIIDGKTCKQMMRQRFVSPDYAAANEISQENSLKYVGAWYEENKKVYFYSATNKQMKMLYDFSLEDNGTFQMDGLTYVVGPRQTGGIEGFKGVYRDIKQVDGESIYRCAPWLEGVGVIYGSPRGNVFNVELAEPMWNLMACYVGDEVIYLNDALEDGATPEGAEARNRFDFTHTIKNQPHSPMRGAAEPSIYGEYSELQLSIHLDPLDDAYLVRITDESGKCVYEKNINAGTIVGLNIDISGYAKGRYTVTVENSQETFTGVFEAQMTGICLTPTLTQGKGAIYNLQGQRISSLQKGLNIVNGQKVYVK